VKYLVLALVFSTGYLAANMAAPQAAADPQAPTRRAQTIPAVSSVANPAIDMEGYLEVAQEAAWHRQTHRISEEDFIKMSAEEGTIVLDARSKQLYDILHIKGAINLSFPDIAIESMAKTFPDKNARILIYCNNNFTDPAKPATAASKTGKGEQDTTAVAQKAFPPKPAKASLNIPTYITLYSYGYKNVYELAPLIDPAKSKLTFESAPNW
jgi:hypothetical protein